MKVFIVEDSAVVLERLAALLAEQTEAEIVGEARSSNEAVEQIQQLQPDVIILDIGLPGGNGIGVLETVKHSRPSSVVIMLTNFAYPQYRERCRQAGADFFFDKSTEFERVVGVVNSLTPRAAPRKPQ
jgi:DNA-binding NarL/FixJ family response regulator